MERRQALFLLASTPVWGQGIKTEEERVAWVGRVLERMLTIKAGMTREKLLSVFTTEGGISFRVRQQFVSVDCPFFKVDVTFTPVGEPDDPTHFYGSRDVILTISRPYLEFSIAD